jgi:very-short-patch-repair endonuclease
MRADLTAPESSAHLKSDRAVVVARRLRKAATPAEKTLWFALRRLPLGGTHFRRQAPFGPFIVDFVCHGARLVIELDGGAHLAPDRALRDLERQQWLESRGYHVLRFENACVLADVGRVAKAIAAEVAMRLQYKDEH